MTKQLEEYSNTVLEGTSNMIEVLKMLLAGKVTGNEAEKTLNESLEKMDIAQKDYIETRGGKR